MPVLILLALVLLGGAPAAAQRALSPGDSAALHRRVEEAEFAFMMSWRYSWMIEMRLVRTEQPDHRRAAPANFASGIDLKEPSGIRCPRTSVLGDVDMHTWQAHNILGIFCPSWSPPNWFEPADERKSIDASLSPEGFTPLAADTARLLRRPIVALLDTAARRLPGDGWIAGQRVRLHLDATEVGAARKAATECRAAVWWCTALLGYVEYTAGEITRASSTFDRARTTMPDSVACAWDDVGLFFPRSVREAYDAIPCIRRDSINARVWWLADPLYVESGNERRTEHYARHVLADLHTALDADERFDLREAYGGRAFTDMIVRYDWPTEMISREPPQQWHWGNTRSVFLGDHTLQASRDSEVMSTIDPSSLGTGRGGRGPIGAPNQLGRGRGRGRGGNTSALDSTSMALAGSGSVPLSMSEPGIYYWGPQFHTVPLWKTVMDPYHATDEGWDLAPPRDGGPYWDTSWWPTEFYRRDNGPLFPLATQAAFFRRQQTPVLAVGMSWDTVAYIVTPVRDVIGALIVSPGPTAPLAGVRDTMNGRTPHPLVAQVPTGPALLSVEMVPRGGAGPSGRSRYGIQAPPSLGTMARGEIALSDVVLASANDNEEAPTTFVAMLPRMLGSTLLRDPKRTALFWELYGVATGDTIGVALRITRKDDANALQRIGSLLGVTRRGDDSLVVRWTEPRPDEPTATVQGGVTIRPRGLVIDMSVLSTGTYALEIAVQRGQSAPVTTRREFRIEHR